PRRATALLRTKPPPRVRPPTLPEKPNGRGGKRRWAAETEATTPEGVPGAALERHGHVSWITRNPTFSGDASRNCALCSLAVPASPRPSRGRGPFGGGWRGAARQPHPHRVAKVR